MEFIVFYFKLKASPKEWKCLFDDKYYEIGEKLDTKNDCIDCECRVPPDFTCVRKVCDSPPVEANCEPIYETNKCCPTYNCTFQQIGIHKKNHLSVVNNCYFHHE